MARRISMVLWCGLLGLMWATPVFAQSGSNGAASSGLGARVFGVLEWQKMAASETFDAVAGTGTLGGSGGGLEVQDVWRRVFVRASVSRLTETGERVFVFNRQVFSLNVPLDISLTPIEASIGWRFKSAGSPGITPYVGGGLLFLKYSETSPGDDASEKVSERYNGITLFGGVEVPVWSRVSAGAEVAWRSAVVSGPGGTLDAFNEDNFGGVSMRVMLSIRR